MKSPLRNAHLFLLLLVGSFLSALASTAGESVSGVAGEKPRYEIGFEQRVRSENWSNLKDWNDAVHDNVNQWRFRTRLWGKLSLGSRAEVMVGLNTENRKIRVPDTPFAWDEIVFETLYLDWRIDDRTSLRFGRQNLLRAEGFALIEGTSGDGSRTTYSNALDLTQSIGKSSKLELLLVSNPYRDIYLPRINDRKRVLTEWDETAAGLYFTSQAAAKTQIDAYYVYKTEQNDTRPPSNASFQPDRSVHTAGGRVDGKLPRGFAITGEAAGQWGSQDPDDAIRAWGGMLRVRKAFERPARPTVSLAYIGLSGDDPATSRREGWGPVFSRWPAWSELYIYSQLREEGIAYWTNIHMLQAEVVVAPWKPLGVRATYYAMGAFHPFPGDPAIFGSGRDRGDLFEIRADVRAGPNWRGHVLYERMTPGDFYVGGDRAYFFRVEAIYAFRITR